MLRTNLNFLSFITEYVTGESSHPIVLKSFKKGTRFIEQGEKTNFVYLIKEGISKCFITEENGKNYILEFLGKGEIIGEIEAIKKINCLCNLEAITPLTLFAIPHQFFLDLINKEPKFNQILLDELSTRLIQTSSRSSYQQLYSLEHGLVKLLQLQKEEDIAISKDDMAAYLGITVRSFNRMLKKINKK